MPSNPLGPGRIIETIIACEKLTEKEEESKPKMVEALNQWKNNYPTHQT